MLGKSSDSVRVFYPKHTRDEILARLKERVGALAALLPLRKVVLFGSYAKGNFTVGSDVDLLVVYRGDRIPEAYALVKKILDIPRLEPHIYTVEEYEKLGDVIKKMVREGITIFEKEND